jgi:uncharacterized protein
MVLEGVVTNVAAFGAFVDIGVHQDGLVHVSAMSASFVSDPRDVAKSGDVVRVRVLSVDIPRKRISLTMRLDDPVEGAASPSGKTDRPSSPAGQGDRGRDNRGGERRGGSGRGGDGGRGGDRRGGGRGGDGGRSGGGRASEGGRGGSQPPATGAMADALRRAGLLGNGGNAGNSGNSGGGTPRRRDDRP